MHVLKRALPAGLAFAGLIHCGASDPDDRLGQEAYALSCDAAWAPTWEQRTSNPWWVEYAISGDVVAAHLEVVGRGTVPLSFQWKKWIGKSYQAIPAGTVVVVHAERSDGERAKTRPFGYLIEPRPQSAPCGGGGACGGGACAPPSCDDAFSPMWEERTANPWWVEYAISGDVVAAHLEVVGRSVVPLSFQWKKWIGKSLTRIPAGTPVVVHAERSDGTRAKTRPFAYLEEKRPKSAPCEAACTPSCEGRTCGDDGCGGSCGTCETCNPATETHRRYLATPEQCAVIRYTCPAGQVPFSNGCGCGCEPSP